jgi:hypothetical protein
LAAAEVEHIRGLIAGHPQWSRRRLSEVLAQQWNWRNGVGQLKDMAARTLLLKLQDRGLVQLPPRRTQPPNRMRRTRCLSVAWDQTPIHSGLSELRPLQVREMSTETGARQLMAAALAQFHYLSYSGTVGQNLQYTVRDRGERPLAFLLFGAAAWQCQERDRFLGWEAPPRERNLGLIAQNARFLLLPWVEVSQLGSWILREVSRRISADCQRKYGHGLALLESFVERDRFAGTAYQAAHWWKVGATTGRTRQDRFQRIQAPVKDLYLYPLRADFREALQA